MNIFFIGLGGAGQRLLRIIKEDIEKDIAVYAYRIKKRQAIINAQLEIIQGSELQEQYSLINVQSIEEGFQLKMDAVFICNPTSMHKEIIKEAIKWKCPIFVEKPVAESTDGMEPLLTKIKNNKLCTMVGYQNRFHPCIKKAKEMIDNQEIGKIAAINAEVSNDVTKWHKYEDYKKLYAVKKDLGGGVILTQSHELDYIYYFMGMPQQVYAVGGNLTDLEMDAEDVASIILEYQRGEKIIPVHLYEDYIQNPPARTCKIIGTKGKIEFDLIENEISCYDEAGNLKYQRKYILYKEQLFHEEVKEFFEALKSKRNTKIPLEEGMASLVIAEAILESIKKKEVVKIDRKGSKQQ